MLPITNDVLSYTRNSDTIGGTELYSSVPPPYSQMSNTLKLHIHS